VGFFDHPKTIKLQRRLGHEGVVCLLRLWLFAARHKCTGLLNGMDDEEIAIASHWPGDVATFVSTLVEVRWLDVEDDGYSLHDWVEHNGFACAATDREDKARFSQLARYYPSIYLKLKEDGVNAITAEDYRRLTLAQRPINERSTNRSTERTTPSPSPSPSPSRKEKSLCSASEKNPDALLDDAGTGVISIQLNDGSESWISQVDVDTWSELFPGVDVMQQLRNMKAWCSSNPRKRKTRKGVRAFVTNWLSREQDRGGSYGRPGGNGNYPGGAGAPTRKTPAADGGVPAVTGGKGSFAGDFPDHSGEW
jgi:hypothetical protein